MRDVAEGKAPKVVQYQVQEQQKQSISAMQKPHAIFLPFPAQGHITPMLYVAKLLHSKGFHITFINTEFNHNRLINSGAIDPKAKIEGFRFEAIPDGLPPSNANATQDVGLLVDSIMDCVMSAPLKQLILRLNNQISGPLVTCMVRDATMFSAESVAAELGIPQALLWTVSGCTFMRVLCTRFKDASCFANGYLDTPIDSIPAMPGICLKDLPSTVRPTDFDDKIHNFCLRVATQKSISSSLHIIDTLEALDHEILDAAEQKFQLPRPYAVGPLFGLYEQISVGCSRLNSVRSNLWEEENECLEWLENSKDGSVVYVNFGSIAVLTPDQLKEFSWGLANSNYPFVWIIRPDLVSGESALLEEEFVEEIRGRGTFASWCPQKQVLAHPSVGGFLTHCGWNSMSESIYHGVPMLCWPYYGDQQPNCRQACNVLGVGMEIDNQVTREKVEGAIKELMEGAKGKEMRTNAAKWKEESRKATRPGGSSHGNFERIVYDLLGMKSD
ncbi:hypothetical protein ACLOJK_013377 [Asimina triloba]